MHNRELELAKDYILHTNRNIFLTGKAGTGKTTLLREIIQEKHKNTVVVAPTGVAAINAGGMTIHSFFQLPPSSFIPSNDPVNPQLATNYQQLAFHQRIRKDKIKLFAELELLIIDEMSMVRADLLDAMDHGLRRFRKNRAPFGGVQVLAIGDLFQLAPVVKQHIWPILNRYYQSPFFFDSLVWKKCNPIEIELIKIYRQEDAHFIQILNNIRNGKLGERDLSRLNQNFSPTPNTSDIISLTTHNVKANRINQSELAKITHTSKILKASIRGNFQDSSLPVDKELVLKKGAQVMFVRNDSEGLFYNGKIGKVIDFKDDVILVQGEEDPDPIYITQVEWKNTRYKLNESTHEIESEELGSFEQYPLKLAWAVTVHKSQGLTFDKVNVDLEDSFAAGQLYVALSRCRSLEGLVLSSYIKQENIIVDQRISAYQQMINQRTDLEIQLEYDKKQFSRILLKRAFELNKLQNYIEIWEEFVKEKNLPSKADILILARDITQTSKKLNLTVEKFQKQLDHLFQSEDDLNIETSLIIDRCQKAIQYFTDELFYHILVPLEANYEKLVVKKKTIKYISELRLLINAFWHHMDILYDLKYKSYSLFSNLPKHIKPERSKFRKAHLPKAKKKKGASKKISLDMFKDGKSLNEIAIERELTVGTIESHMSFWLKQKEVQILDLMPAEKVNKIWDLMEKTPEASLSEIRSRLSFEASFSELRWVKAWHFNDDQSIEKTN